VKTAEDGDGLIVRLYEAHNRRGPAEITFDRPIASATEVNLLEHEIAQTTTDGSTLRFEVRPYEVKTFRVRLG
jgi:alpha-mannosidase